MKKTIFAVALVALLALSGQASAVIGTIDQVPAATLLLPYFEVDLGNPSGVTTLFSINNASATAVLAHVTVWSDLSIAVLDFDVYLTGYDVQTINMRDILNGTLPRTASAGQDPTDTISPKGDFSQDINFASCQNILPYAQLPSFFVGHLQTALTGQTDSYYGGCAGQPIGDNIARGYVTVDTVSSCSTMLPSDLNYSGILTFQNVLWGDYFYVNSAQNFASGDTLVHIEASTTDPRTSTAGQYTFWGRYNNWSAADHREALATTFAARFVNGGAFSGGTDFVVWRDSRYHFNANVTCPATDHLPWYPLANDGLVIFDEEENPQVPQTFPVSPPPINQGLVPFPAEAQRTAVGGSALPVPWDFGWMYLVLNTNETGVTGVSAPATIGEDVNQAWVSVVMSAEGRYSVGYDAIQLDNASAANHFSPATGP